MKKLSKSGIAFRNKNKHKSTELSKHIWELKGNNIQHQINCNRASRAQHYNDCTRKCDLCLTQKLIIAKADPSSPLKKRDELISECRHMNRCPSEAIIQQEKCEVIQHVKHLV